MTLLAAGYETTATQIVNSAYTLLTQPGQLVLPRDRRVTDAEALEGRIRS